MLTVTETASAYLAQLLVQASKPDDMVVRLERGTTGNLTLRFDYMLPDDTTFEHKDRAVLVFGPQIAPILADNTLDVQDEEDGPQLVVRRQEEEDA
jgi:Fe-S cluster assembly iron-binding protein IscA